MSIDHNAVDNFIHWNDVVRFRQRENFDEFEKIFGKNPRVHQLLLLNPDKSYTLELETAVGSL